MDSITRVKKLIARYEVKRNRLEETFHKAMARLQNGEPIRAKRSKKVEDMVGASNQ